MLHLGKAILDAKLDQELIDWFTTYVQWSFGWGRGQVITPRNWIALENYDREILWKFVSLLGNFESQSDTVTSIRELRNATCIIVNHYENHQDAYEIKKAYAIARGIKERILNQKMAEWNKATTIEAKRSVCLSDYWCNCDDLYYEGKTLCAQEFFTRLWLMTQEPLLEQIDSAETIADLKAINVYDFNEAIERKNTKIAKLLAHDRARRINDAANKSS